ncbi:hypothetical protein TNCV_3893021 [Trichonephila clavipes]|nr:hypothetical protein TNCV_3893021 [Trichonephila clavipes]
MFLKNDRFRRRIEQHNEISLDSSRLVGDESPKTAVANRNHSTSFSSRGLIVQVVLGKSTRALTKREAHIQTEKWPNFHGNL